MVKGLISVAQTFILIFPLVCYSNICNRLSETNAPEHRVQTSLKRCGLKFSLRQDMSAKFPRGGGSRTFFSSKSSSGCPFIPIYQVNSPAAHVRMKNNFMHMRMRGSGKFCQRGSNSYTFF